MSRINFHIIFQLSGINGKELMFIFFSFEFQKEKFQSCWNVVDIVAAVCWHFHYWKPIFDFPSFLPLSCFRYTTNKKAKGNFSLLYVLSVDCLTFSQISLNPFRQYFHFIPPKYTHTNKSFNLKYSWIN